MEIFKQRNRKTNFKITSINCYTSIFKFYTKTY